MVHYVIEELKSTQKSDPKSEGDAVFSILELPSRKQVGTLRRFGKIFTAESKTYRNTSEASSGLLVLKMAFRSNRFFIKNGETMTQLKEEDLV